MAEIVRRVDAEPRLAELWGKDDTTSNCVWPVAVNGTPIGAYPLQRDDDGRAKSETRFAESIDQRQDRLKRVFRAGRRRKRLDDGRGMHQQKQGGETSP